MPDQPIPQQHRSPEADVNHGPCQVGVSILGVSIDTAEVGRIFPEWVPVESENPVILEGKVVANNDQDYPGPDVSFDDFPTSHYTHDFNFFVQPDSTPDNRYTNLLGIRVWPDGHEITQEVIAVEWETGLGASNDGNPLADANRRGDSGGFFSTGHRRRETIWNWPTLGDWVHVEGRWIWDRGHPPAETEIHPPRLVAIRRHLPTMSNRRVDPSGIEPGAPTLVTQIDIFASSDGGALSNNRPGAPPFVQRVPMSDRDYSFIVPHPLPRPNSAARLGWNIIRHNGDTFPGDPDIVVLPSDGPIPNVQITIPWHSRQVPDTAVFARSVQLYWDQLLGVPEDYRPRVFRVTLEQVHVIKSQDEGDGEYRLFVEAGGNWFFVNEAPGDDDILNDGLGDTGDDQFWGINRQFVVYIPPGGNFRVHAGGWEADGINDVFGKLLDPNHPCNQELKDWLNNNLFTFGVFASGAEDDPIGEVNSLFDQTNGFGVGEHIDSSHGPFYNAQISAQSTDPNDSYRLHYRIEELSWPFLG